MKACAPSVLGEPKYSGLVEAVLGATGWPASSGMCERCSGLTRGGGAEASLLIVTCIYSGLSRVAPVESLDCVSYMVQVFCYLPDFIVFW